MTDVTRKLKTGDLADAAGVNIHTVRYYESRGLLPKPPRTGSGYRMYGLEDVKRLRFIKRAQELGFTLEEIGELLELRVEPGAGQAVRSHTAVKIDEIDGKIRDLERIRAKLVELSAACDQHGTHDDCRVLHALEDDATHS
jgi:MerR family transcriptional regulator, copper efflux regulator